MRNPAQWRRTLGQSRWCGNRETQPEGTLLSRSLRDGSPPSLTERDYSVRSRHQKSWLCSVRDVMVQIMNRRFVQGEHMPQSAQWLSDNGSGYIAWETQAFARDADHMAPWATVRPTS